MLNYYSRVIEPIASAITDEMKRKFLTKTARTQGQTIMSFRDPFKLVPVKELAELADKFTRNEIMSSNEIRQVVGMKPSDDPKADQLINSNLNQAVNNIPPEEGMGIPPEEGMGVLPEEGENVPQEGDVNDQILDTLTDEQQEAVGNLISDILSSYGINLEEENKEDTEEQ